MRLYEEIITTPTLEQVEKVMTRRSTTSEDVWENALRERLLNSSSIVRTFKKGCIVTIPDLGPSKFYFHKDSYVGYNTEVYHTFGYVDLYAKELEFKGGYAINVHQITPNLELNSRICFSWFKSHSILELKQIPEECLTIIDNEEMLLRSKLQKDLDKLQEVREAIHNRCYHEY